MATKSNRRIGLISLILLIALFILVLSRMLYLTYNPNIGRKEYSDPILPTSLVRGSIYNRTGNLLALQSPNYVFRIDTERISPSVAAKSLEDMIDLSPLEAEALLSRGTSTLLYNGIPNSEMVRNINLLLEERGLSESVKFDIIEERKYSSGTSLSSILGSVDPLMRGISGAEKTFNERLTPKIELKERISSGEDIYLTIDESLEWLMDTIYIPKGYTVVIFSGEGSILAAAGEINNELILYMARDENRVSPLFEEAEETETGSYRVYITSGVEKEGLSESISSMLESLTL